MLHRRVAGLAAAVVLAFGLGDAVAQTEDEPVADDGLEIGTYERQALKRALANEGLELETTPEGKLVGRIIVVNLPVFGEDLGFLTWFNHFHITTREEIVEREVLLRPGQPWDPETVEETRRRLADPLFTTLVVVAPVKSDDYGLVDLLVVTRDIWSLRMNSQFEFQEGKLTELSLSISENNLLGRRKQIAFVFDMDQGAYFLGPKYLDKNIAGTRLQLSTWVGALFSRETSEFEGTTSTTAFSYPLWSLKREWGASLIASHHDSVVRLFRGTQLRTYDDPATPEMEALPWIYRYRTANIESSVVRSLGSGYKHRFRLGHELKVRRPSFTDDFPLEQAGRDAFESGVFPRSERSSALFLRYSMFEPDYVVYRNLDSYDLAEDMRAGPSANAEVGFALKPIGSEYNFVNLSASASWTLDIRDDGFFRVGSGAGGRLQDGELIDNVVSGSLSAATPAVANLFRVVGQARAAFRLRESGNQFYVLGGDNGLRGYQIGAFAGERRVLTNLEVRTMPMKILFTRVGGLVFWDMGHAADRVSNLRMHHDVGIGLRSLVPQLQPFVFRFDWAIPMTGSTQGFPGRFSAGVAQAF